MKIQHVLCIFYTSVVAYVLVCVILQQALWREEVRGLDEVRIHQH